HVGDAIVKPATTIEQLLEDEPVRVSFPGIAHGIDALTIPGRIGLGLIDQVICDHPRMSHLITITRPETIIRYRGYVRPDEDAEGISQIIVVVDVAAIDAMLFIKAIIQPQQLLPEIKWIR